MTEETLHQDHIELAKGMQRNMRVDILAIITVVIGVIGFGWTFTAWAAEAHQTAAEAITKNAEVINAVMETQRQQREAIQSLEVAVNQSNVNTARFATVLDAVNSNLQRIDQQLTIIDERLRKQEQR